MRHLDQNSRAVARVRLAAARAAMIQVDQNFQGIGDHLVRFFALHVDHEAQPAGIVFELRIVKSLFRRRGNLSLRAPFLVPIAASVFLVINCRNSRRPLIFYSKFMLSQ